MTAVGARARRLSGWVRRLARKPHVSGTEGDSSSGAGPPVCAGEWSDTFVGGAGYHV